MSRSILSWLDVWVPSYCDKYTYTYLLLELFQLLLLLRLDIGNFLLGLGLRLLQLLRPVCGQYEAHTGPRLLDDLRRLLLCFQQRLDTL